jgi:uncharacterized protein (TIGR03084 family)
VVDLDSLLADLDLESADLDALVGATPDWSRPTPAPGWTIAHQIAHLAWTDRVAELAATDTDAFYQSAAIALQDPTGFVDRTTEQMIAPRGDLLATWRAGRAALTAALRAVPAGTRLPWYGPPMSVASMATARLMETWAHGQDCYDALDQPHQPTDRLRHIAHLGVRTQAFGFQAHDRPVPDEPVFVALTGPRGDTWAFGDAAAENRIEGPAVDFCLLVTQRRHVADLALVATGPVAREWLTVAQVFAGPPGRGREPAR